MELTTHPFETVIFSNDVFFSKSYNPSLEVAKKVIFWHFERSIMVDKGSIRNLLTGEIETFVRQEKEVVSSHTGEFLDECPSCAEKDVENNSLKRDLKAWQARYSNLEKLRKKEVTDSGEWEIAECVFDVWRVHCKHERSRFSMDRFLEIAPMLGKYSFEILVRAVAGAAFDCYQDKRKNGTIKHYNDFELIFRDSSHVEEFARKAPLPWALTNYTDRNFDE